MKEQVASYEAATAVLGREPLDAASNATVAKYYMVITFDWAAALLPLTRADLGALSEAAKTELMLPDNPDVLDVFTLANTWWDCARDGSLSEPEIASVQQHAARLYDSVVDKLTDPILRKLAVSRIDAANQSTQDLPMSFTAKGRRYNTANLIADSGFDSGKLAKWAFRSYVPKAPASCDVEKTSGRNGTPALKLCLKSMPGVIEAVQKIPVEPNSKYILRGWIRTSGVVADNGRDGANLNVIPTWTFTQHISGTTAWTPVRVEFTTAETKEVEISCRLGYYNSSASGEAWFDDIEVVPAP